MYIEFESNGGVKLGNNLFNKRRILIDKLKTISIADRTLSELS